VLVPRGLNHPEKVLVFSNARRRVDLLAADVRPRLVALGYEVRATTAVSQGQSARRRKRRSRPKKRSSCLQTSTLEIGIDIGDVDLVVLDGPAPDVPALLQRIGRGNRRTNKTRVMTCAGSLAEVLIHAAMVEAARDGALDPSTAGRTTLSRGSKSPHTFSRDLGGRVAEQRFATSFRSVRRRSWPALSSTIWLERVSS